PAELPDQLRSAIDALLNAGGYAELEHLLSHRSVLRAPLADRILSDMVERREAAQDRVGVAMASTRLWLLRRTKEIGVQAALAELQAIVANIEPAFQELAYYLSEGRLPLSILDDREARVRLLAEDPALFAKVEAVMRAVHRDAFEGRSSDAMPDELR